MLEESAVTRGKWMLAAAWAVVLVGARVHGAELNTLRGLDVSRTGSGAQVVVTGTRPPTFTVFRLSGPERLVVDLSSADATGIKGHHEGSGPVSGVVASQFSDQRASVGRVLLALDKASQYDVRADGNRVVISVDGTSQSVDAKRAETPARTERMTASVEAKPHPVAAQAPAKVVKAESAAVPKAALPENVVAAEADEREVSNPAQHITAMSFADDTLSIRADGDIARYEVLELADPPRLAVDLFGVGLATRAPRVKSGALRDVRVGAHADKVRLVLDVRGTMPAYRVDRANRGLEVVLGRAVARTWRRPLRPRAVVASVAEVEPLRQTPVKSDASPVVEVKDVRFEESSSGGRIVMKLSGTSGWKVDRPDPRSAVLTLDNARLPKKFERSLDTSALDTPVKMISAFSVPGAGGKVRLVVAADGAIEEKVSQSAGTLSWRLDVKGVKTEEVAVAQRTAGFTTEAPAYAAEGAPQQARYRGKRVSFEFKDIDIQNLLRVIAEISKKNIVVADDVSGKVTIRLRNVPWDQALDLVLRTKALGKEEFGNIIRIAPLKTLEEEARLRQERKKSLQQQEDLMVNLLPVNYAVAADMAARVKDVLSERGSVTVDQRTNVLIVKDVRSNTERARSLVRSLDTQTPQVLIESRIVEANTSFSRSLGVQWGGQARAGQATGNSTGLIFPNNLAVTGGVTGTGAGLPDNPNFAVNLPTGTGQGVGGAMGFTFGSAGGALQLNLRLSAAENEGSVKTISAPKVTTLDNNTARINQGVSIPFSQTSAQGVNTTFVEARLSLEVTPHITQDGSVLMSINASNNQPDPSSTGANGQPSIQRKEANTQVLVKDGDTTVIGGIYVRRGATQVNSVPFLSRIPVLGLLFKNNSETDTRQELLIFITPRILNRQTIAQTL
uniref:PilQ n=1 Tax=Myxococcus xanthus (strain DK1622) TaxID=246197 RepID=Q9ZFG1_MYXXD|nr:Chain Qa, PilQ [Myxococcus xanthus DK 1622]3JC8_Qb Chain Qb, PilQ [Myxococcus xanthus DK 1622]3JC8_Qc Chain Qc, PilQ [Myxococcus xanthus DK 1622]3JC8_Qd Chain Qd, PilQ [Myxococcus xanthus DK 1622]3JC8_Qe Chain Qe, PilQ [Myxococcus xanthus DK 1622]3JC8_Qf Chain Qf, PilQ [Myxococcus xanthus DK 1622]3JC8_Qg Chain Qg, PilQ [Myxococcus xanthus DK 1622]3JC8_Qh Chain Qh, PilQ [Myxococcus xanthus DK 1622]3JC8_Qi Chain Qi, PilQ [Myxococcus xanthus DK 1622]3JC8_Qj Chain Qj, PilQ [Myxococcus xanth